MTDIRIVHDPCAPGAELSPCGRYRYKLWRTWNPSLPAMIWVLLNPSTADALTDDPTVRKCIGFAARRGCGGIIMVNLFAFRATFPDEVPIAEEPIGPRNDDAIRWALSFHPRTIVAAWGAPPWAEIRARQVGALLDQRAQVFCLGTTKSGQPRHPLYLPYDTPLQEWRLAR